jgi:hypothetical protein
VQGSSGLLLRRIARSSRGAWALLQWLLRQPAVGECQPEKQVESKAAVRKVRQLAGQESAVTALPAGASGRANTTGHTVCVVGSACRQRMQQPAHPASHHHHTSPQDCRQSTCCPALLQKPP